MHTLLWFFPWCLVVHARQDAEEIAVMLQAIHDGSSSRAMTSDSALLQSTRVAIGQTDLLDELDESQGLLETKRTEADTCKGWCAKKTKVDWTKKCEWRWCKGCDECATLTTTSTTSTVFVEKYHAVGCMPTTMSKKTSIIEATAQSLQACLDDCKAEDNAFGGFTCTNGRVQCRCFTGGPWESYWASPHHLRYTNKFEHCVDTSGTCSGPIGNYLIAGKDSMTVYGLKAAEAWTTTKETYTPVAVIPAQPALAATSTASGECKYAGGLPLSTGKLDSHDDYDFKVPAGETYYVEESMEVGKLLIEEGATLYFKDRPRLVLGALTITVKGTLQIGTKGCPLTKGGAGIVLRGEKPEAPKEADKGLSVLDGAVLDIHGRPYAPTWTRLASSAPAGKDAVVLQQAVDWEIGQEVVVVSTTFVDDEGDHQNEVRTIKKVDGFTVTFTEPLAFYHYGGPEYQAEVGLLSRSVSIDGDDQSDEEEFGGHVMCHPGSTCRLSYVRGYKLGQKNIEGRYPFHFHMMGNVAQQSYMEGLSVYKSYFRAFVIHAVSNMTLSRCVAYRISGNAVYLEDGIEEDNLIAYNLVAHVLPIAPHTHPWIDYDKSGPAIETIPERILPSDLTPAAFYNTNPNNRWIGNAASGGFSGYIFPMLGQVLGKSFKDHPNYKPVEQDLLEFDGNTCHSSGQWYKNGACIYVGGSLSNTEGNSSHYSYWYWKFGADTMYRGAMSFTNSKFFASRAGLKSWGLKSGRRPAVTITNSEFHDNMLALAFFGHNEMENTVITGHSGNALAFPSYTPVHGFQTYDTSWQTVMTNVAFRGFKGPYDFALYSFVVAECCTPVGLLGVKKLSFPDTPLGKRLVLNPREDTSFNFNDTTGHAPQQWANVQDVDGGLTGISGGAILGAADSHKCFGGVCPTYQWWRLDDKCENMFKDSDQSRGYWACPKKLQAGQDRTVVAIVGSKEDSSNCKFKARTKDGVTYYSDAPSCSRGNAPLEGTYYHFGHTDRKVYFGWNSLKAAKLVTGPCCDIGWYFHAAGDAPAVIQLMLEQMVPSGGLVWATTYPMDATITVEKCVGWEADACQPLAKASSKSEFLASVNGTLIMIDSSTNTVFLKLVNEKNVWFREHVLASQFFEHAQYIIRSSTSAAAEMRLPAKDWLTT